MEAINLNAIVKTPAANESNTKSKDVKADNKGFSKVLKDTKTSDTNDKVQKNDLTQGNTSSNVEESSNHKDLKLNNDASELIQLLLQLSGGGTSNNQELMDAIKAGDEKKLKSILTDLITSSLSAKDQNTTLSLISQDLNVKDFNVKDLLTNLKSVTSFKDVEKLAGKLAEKLVNDQNFKSQLTALLGNISEIGASKDIEGLKQVIISKLNDMIKNDSLGEKKKDITVHLPQKVILNQLNTDKKEQVNVKPENTVDTELTNNSLDVDGKNKVQADSKFSSKEDRLLKNLVSEDSSKNSKDTVSDKIANVVSRFEAINTDKPTMVEGKVAINKNNFNTDFIKAVKFMDLNNLKELTVKVLPKDLGEIVIRLSLDNGVMKANITAANKDTYNLLNAQLPAISNQLSEQNMSIQSFSLSLYNGDNFLFNGNGNDGGQGKQQGSGKTSVAGIDDEDITQESYSVEDNNLNILA